MLEQAVYSGVVECPKCGSLMEPDCPKCYKCGKPNPLVTEGYI